MLPEKFFDKVLEIERQIDELKENTPHDLLQTLMTLFSDAIEYYGANDDNEMCIDLNMRMQSILVRPYILDCLCEHNNLSREQSRSVRERLASDDYQSNFEKDNRRSNNPYKYKNPKKEEIYGDVPNSKIFEKLEQKEQEQKVIGIIS